MEFDEIVVKESPGLCRCCLSEGCYKDMGTEYTWMHENEVYADMLLECFDIGISQHNEGPNGPNRLICEVCITRLRDACNFKKQVLESEKKFVDMIGRGEFRPKVLIYQSQMKAEAGEDVEDTEVEYLEEDIGDYVDDDELVKTAASASASDSAPKRGRPRKADKPDKKRKLEDRPRTSKATVKDAPDKMLQKQKRMELSRLLRSIFINTSLVPFRWHNGKYMCFICTNHYIEISKLREHFVTHSFEEFGEIIGGVVRSGHRIKLDIGQNYCNACETELYSLEDFLDHLGEQHGQSFHRDMIARFEVYHLDDEVMHCLECDETFRHFFQLLKHTHQEHADVKEHKFLCEICGQGFADKGGVTTHINQTHYAQQCKHCSESFETCYALDKHVGTVHKIENCQCPFCFELLPNRYMRKRHLALVHDWKSAQVKCDVCNKIFTRNSKLLLHKRRVHMKERDVACEECGLQFFDLGALGKHQVCHRNERPFQCGLCLKAFERKVTLMVHMASNHVMEEK